MFNTVEYAGSQKQRRKKRRGRNPGLRLYGSVGSVMKSRGQPASTPSIYQTGGAGPTLLPRVAGTCKMSLLLPDYTRVARPPGSQLAEGQQQLCGGRWTSIPTPLKRANANDSDLRERRSGAPWDAGQLPIAPESLPLQPSLVLSIDPS
ncbi:hypothetical protein EYF80_052735 [Liparis tanakae]|uniref:Uncharacterized protein n=1 Tax=Liparis tanakae TaxID=230148 RepID=A0A4Z2F8F9_9TELE|nr:hypothetical protein EYF80_052735 [Liparis tanakae]